MLPRRTRPKGISAKRPNEHSLTICRARRREPMNGPTKQRVAGRELDAEIAERVLGVRVIRDSWGGLVQFYGEYPNGFYATPRPYTTEIRFAWRVVENLAERGWKIDVQNRFPPTWACHVNFPAHVTYSHVFETADSAPLAICLAALEALEAVKLAKIAAPSTPSAVVSPSEPTEQR